jgi:hypothetical protein
MNKKIIAISVLIAILFVGAIAGTMFYYNGVVNDKNSKIVSLNTQIANQNNEIANLTSQISNLKSQLTNFTSGNLVASLGISEVGNTSTSAYLYPYYRLYISGTVTNTGIGEAYNAGLHVVAYTANGILEINMTVPLTNGEEGVNFGTDSATNAYVLNWASSIGSSIGSLQLGNLDSGQTATVDLNIYHEGVVSNWTVTPVCYTYPS